jgi:hypothetical protein
LVESIQSRLFNIKTSITAVVWKLGPYERLSDTEDLSMVELSSIRWSTTDITRRIFEAIESANLGWFDTHSHLEGAINAVNSTQKMTIPLEHFDAQVSRFYSTMSPAAASANSFVVDSTPLTRFVFAFENGDFGVMSEMLDALLDMGADRHIRDQCGLSAYDHARILKLDAVIVDKLNPFIDNRGDAEYALLEAVQKGKNVIAAKFLTKQLGAHTIDGADRSPLALAVHAGNATIVPALLNAGFSPFAVYVTEEALYPSMACAIFSGSDLCTNLVPIFRAYFSAEPDSRDKGKTVPDMICLALETVDKRHYRYDSLVLGVLLDMEQCVRICLVGKKEMPRGQVDKLDRILWAMYAAIRCGYLNIVGAILGEQRASGMEHYFRRSHLDQRHFLAQWWPYPCWCPQHVHVLGDRTLGEYSKDLELAPLCSSCKKKLPQYRKLSRYLDTANGRWDAMPVRANGTAR